MSVEEKVCVKVLGSMINYAAGQIAKFDNDFKDKLKGLNEVIQWKIGDDIAYYTEIKDQDIKGVDGTAPSPTLTFEISDIGVALKLLTAQADMGSLGDVVKVSDPEKAQQLAFILEKVGEYSEGMQG